RAFYSHCAAPPPDRPPFPTRRSSDLPVRQIVGEIGRPEDFPPTGEDHLLRVEPILAPEVRTQRRTVPLQQGKERQEFGFKASNRSEEHTSELQSRENLVCRLLLGKKN